MIFWGSRTKVVYVDEIAGLHCTACADRRPMELFLQYRVYHIEFVFRWVRRKLYLARCRSCGHETAIDRAEAERGRTRNVIPIFDRLSWVLAAAGFALIPLGAVIGQRTDLQRIAEPRVNDIYEFDEARILPRPEAPVMYTLMRVRAVTPQGVQFQRAKSYYDLAIGLDRAIDSGRARQDDYYGSDTFTFPVERLRQMHTDGIILHVVR